MPSSGLCSSLSVYRLYVNHCVTGQKSWPICVCVRQVNRKNLPSLQAAGEREREREAVTMCGGGVLDLNGYRLNRLVCVCVTLEQIACNNNLLIYT